VYPEEFKLLFHVEDVVTVHIDGVPYNSHEIKRLKEAPLSPEDPGSRFLKVIQNCCLYLEADVVNWLKAQRTVLDSGT
jgi:hypothetical protein